MAGLNINLPKLSLERFSITSRADYRFSPFNALLLVAFMLIGLIVHVMLYEFSVVAVVYTIAAALVLAGMFRLTQLWEGVVVMGALVTLAGYLLFRTTFVEPRVLVAATVAAALIAPCVQIAYQWERAVLLRFGKFVGIRGPGLFVVLPVIDKVSQFVDQRIRVTDFQAEMTLTKDTVPVNVDAIAFWMVWDAEKAVLEVADFDSAVVLSAQTALRDAIGRSELADLLSHRDRLGKEIQQVLDHKTNPWGITAQSVEVRDIIIPKGLEDAMSKQAQAERERQSRIILGTAETEIAEKFAKASEAYQNNPVALHLRAMNMVFEGLKQKGSMVIVPSTAVESMGLGALGGLTALGQPVRMMPSANSSPKAEPSDVTDQA
ncbi:MAG TPA: slipin family protein [Phycisphaerae bacterium]|nr:slipin family protein [Phycisphaerae bacterium]